MLTDELKKFYKIFFILITAILLVGSSCDSSTGDESMSTLGGSSIEDQPNSITLIRLLGASLTMFCSLTGTTESFDENTSLGFFNMECTLENYNQFSSTTSLIVAYSGESELLTDNADTRDLTEFDRIFLVEAQDRRTKVFTRPIPTSVDREMYFYIRLYDIDTSTDVDSVRISFPFS